MMDRGRLYVIDSMTSGKNTRERMLRGIQKQAQKFERILAEASCPAERMHISWQCTNSFLNTVFVFMVQTKAWNKLEAMYKGYVKRNVILQ